MCVFGSSPKTPPIPAPTPPPSKSDEEVAKARADEAKRRRLSLGRGSTVLTSALGAEGTAKTKTKLGE